MDEVQRDRLLAALREAGFACRARPVEFQPDGVIEFEYVADRATDERLTEIKQGAE